MTVSDKRLENVQRKDIDKQGTMMYGQMSQINELGNSVGAEALVIVW